MRVVSRSCLFALWTIGCATEDPAARGKADTDAPPQEICDGEDNDGDGAVDEDLLGAWYPDADGDFYGDSAGEVWACDPPPGHVGEGGDCDDADPEVNPGRLEWCTGKDDNCDGVVDADAQDAVDWYPDTDGDGFGDRDAAPRSGCTPGLGETADATDCDDGDAAVNPAATEVCNGWDDDCSDQTPETGLAMFTDGDGARTDWTAHMVGLADNPTTLVLTQPGTLDLCGGTFYTSLRLRADVHVRGLGAESSTLHGGDQTGVVIVRTDGLSVVLEDLDLVHGAGVGAVLGELSAGGGLECDAQSQVSLGGVRVAENQADVGAGVFVRGCTLTLEQVRVESNDAAYYGGGLAALNGEVWVEESEISGNYSRYGGGLALIGLDGTSTATLLDSELRANEAEVQGGGAIVEGAHLDCVGDVGLDAGVMGNQASTGGGVYLGHGATLTSALCDWGGTGDPNSPEDLNVSTTDYDQDADFGCDTEGCQ